ncbi:MAG: hypothetical protein NW701_20425 [Nitrospira sp.]
MTRRRDVGPLGLVHPFFAAVMILCTAVGCVSQSQALHRLHGDAATTRCQSQMRTHFLPLPHEAGRRDFRGNPVAKALPARVREAADAIDVLGPLIELRELEQGQGIVEGPEVAWRLLQTRQRISHRIALAALDVSSTVAELDCEESRADHVADGLREMLQQRSERDLFLIFAGDIWLGIIAGSLGLAGHPTTQAEAAIVGGILETSIGLLSAFADETYEFRHPRNHLRDIRDGSSGSEVFPGSVWRYFNGPSWVLPGETIRQALLEYWKEEGRLGQTDEVERRRTELFFGDGGVYGMKDLRIRAEMLNHLKSEVLRIGQDLNNLLYEVLTHDPELLQKENIFQAVGLPLRH